MRQIERVIAYVDGGVAASIDQICHDVLGIDFNELSQEEQEELESEIFTCEDCGWTMPTDDMLDEEGKCHDCAKEGVNEEDE